MIIEQVRILRFDIKGGYRIKEELWKLTPEDKPTRMRQAYTDKGDYIGDVKTAKFLCKRMDLTNLQKTSPDHCVVSIGFNEKEQKWYGWSHRAIYGFGIGSQVKKGDCAYTPATPKELFDEVTAVSRSEEDGFEYQWLKPENVELTEDGIRVRESMVKCVMNEDGICTHTEPTADHFWEIKCGRGEWTALTLDDAKQMAIDFSNSVS